MWLEALVQRYSRAWTEQHPSTQRTTALLQCGKPFWPCRHGFSGRGRAHKAASIAPIPTIHRDTKVSIACVPVWALTVNCPRSHDTQCKRRHSIVFVKKTQTKKKNLQSEITCFKDVHQHLLMLKTHRHTSFLCHFHKVYTTGQRGDNLIVSLEAASVGCAGVLPGPL